MQFPTHLHAAPVLSALLFAMTTWVGVRECEPNRLLGSVGEAACTAGHWASESTREANATWMKPEGGAADGPGRRWEISRELFRGPLDRSVVSAARALLDLPLGSEVVLAIRGMLYGVRLEPHYHPPGYQGGPIGWHKGVTLYQVMARASHHAAP